MPRIEITGLTATEVQAKIDAQHATDSGTYAPIAEPIGAAAQATANAATVKANNGSDFADAGTTRANLHVPILTSCQAVATTNLTLSGTQTVDGYAAVVGDLILAAGQTTGSQNGPWVVAAGAWTRPTDYATGLVIKGRTVQVNTGSTKNIGLWTLQTSTSVTVDTTATTWAMANLSPNNLRPFTLGLTNEYFNTSTAQTSGATLTGTSNELQLGDATSGAITLTLPTTTVKYRFIFSKKDSTTNTVTIAAGGTGTIGALSTVVLYKQWDYLIVVGTGVADQWAILGQVSSVTPVAAIPKQAVRVAAPINVTVSSPGATVDAVALSSGDRVLLPNQTTASENGIYVFNGSSSAMTRATDANTGSLLIGAFVYATSGATNARSGWELTNTAITLETTSITWVQFEAPWVTIPGTLPAAGAKSGLYYFCNSQFAASTGAISNGTVRVSPWLVTAPITLSAIGIELTVAGDAASMFRVGVWADDGTGYPTSLVLDAGTISTGSSNSGTVATGGVAGVYMITGLTQIVMPGLYWVGGTAQGVTTTGPTVRTISGTGGLPYVPVASSSLPSAGANFTAYSGSNQTGAFTTFGTPANISTVPRIIYKAA